MQEIPGCITEKNHPEWKDLPEFYGGLGPLWSQESPALSKELKEEAEEWKQRYLSGIIHGTDPSHEEYWGDLVDYDQKW